MKSPRTWAIGLTSGLALVACGGQHQPESAGTVQPTTTPPASIDGPFLDLLTGEVDYVTYERTVGAVQMHAKDVCLRKAGFRPKLTPARSDDLIGLTRLGIAYRAPNGLPDRGYRRQFGYGIYAGAVGLKTPMDLPTDLREPSAEESAAQDKCAPEVRTAVFSSSVERFFDDWAGVEAAAVADSRYVQAIQDWVGCMRGQGYKVKGLDDVSELVTQDLYAANRAGLSTAAQLKGFRASELTTAEADWSCRVKHVNDVWRTVRDEKENAYLEDHPELAKQVADDMHWVAQKAG